MAHKQTIVEIERQLKEVEVENEFIQSLKTDGRKGVQTLLRKWETEQERRGLQREKQAEMTYYERLYLTRGYTMIAGIDEVGRGPLAGPVVAAAVILPVDFYVSGIDDSKKLSEKKREELYDLIRREAVSIGIGVISAAEVDEINIYEATKKAMFEAIVQLHSKPDFLLIDAMKLETYLPFEAIIKGDAKSVSIAAASIIAKVTRDRWMKEQAKLYPGYGFEQHMGYGTKAHLDALKLLGPTPIHRKSFAPVKELE